MTYSAEQEVVREMDSFLLDEKVEKHFPCTIVGKGEKDSLVRKFLSLLFID
jgi:hypothetical protein